MKCEDLWGIFQKNDLDFFTGVPDSTFKEWMTFLDDNDGIALRNIVACNECEAVAIAAGYHLGTGKIGIVYMQNSGEGKAVNPLASLCDPEVYSIPVILMIGWRGEPGIKDEPQHKKMGRVMLPLLEVLDIPFKILPDKMEEAADVIGEIKEIAHQQSSPVALIVRNRVLDAYHSNKKRIDDFEMTREEAIKTIINELEEKAIIVSTTGKTSRELFEHRLACGRRAEDFYTVGSMGCASSIAFGISLQHRTKNVYVFDGDGAALMQMGAFSTIGHYKPENFTHFLIDNNSHESTGGQPTNSDSVDFVKVALACGYEFAEEVKTRKELVENISRIKSEKGPKILVIKVKKGSRKDLGRPSAPPLENKKQFMKHVRD